MSHPLKLQTTKTGNLLQAANQRVKGWRINDNPHDKLFVYCALDRLLAFFKTARRKLVLGPRLAADSGNVVAEPATFQER
jgi:hypothetical protein